MFFAKCMLHVKRISYKYMKKLAMTERICTVSSLIIMSK